MHTLGNENFQTMKQGKLPISMRILFEIRVIKPFFFNFFKHPPRRDK